LPRAPRLTAPTLLIVGEVVRFADPIPLTQEFTVPNASTDSDMALPALLDMTGFEDFGKEQEPVA
jgi:hypothetical protein